MTTRSLLAGGESIPVNVYTLTPCSSGNILINNNNNKDDISQTR